MFKFYTLNPKVWNRSVQLVYGLIGNRRRQFVY